MSLAAQRIKCFTIAARFCLGSLDTCILVALFVAYGTIIAKREIIRHNRHEYAITQSL